MKILIIDDKIEEMKRAEKAVNEAGHEAVVCLGPHGLTRTEIPERGRATFSRSDIPVIGVWAAVKQLIEKRSQGENVGILTDLMFPMTISSGVQPSGLVVAAHAIAHDVPVVICTDPEGSHHEGPCGMVRDGYIGSMKGEPAFGFNSSKDWTAAVAELERRSSSRP